MAVKIRLARRGRKKMAMYDIVVAESASPRDGRFIEKIGTYNPNTDPSTVVLKSDRALHWLMVGAQPTDTTRSVLSHEGIMYRKHLQVGVNKGAISQEQADERFSVWKDDKENRKAGAADTKTQTNEQARAARLESERKVNETRAEAIAKKNKVEEPVVDTVPATPVEAVVPVQEIATAEAVAPAEEAAPVDEVVATEEVVAPEEAAPAEEVVAAEEVGADVAAEDVPATEVAATEADAETPAAETAEEKPKAE